MKINNKNNPNFMKNKQFALLLLCSAFLSMVAISCKKTSNELTEELIEEYVLDGIYADGIYGSTSNDNMEIEIIGNTGYIKQFGSFNFFNNSNYPTLGITPENIVNVGDIYLKNITKTDLNTYSVEVLVGQPYSETVSVYSQVSFIQTEMKIKKNEFSGKLNLYFSNTSIYPNSIWESTANNGGGGTGGSDCIVGVWYSEACGNPNGVVWTFNSNGTGSFSNPDCNGICTNIVFNFSYTISGSTCTVDYDAQQPLVYCDGYDPASPQSPNTESFSFECSGNTLTVTSGTGTNVFTK